MKNYPIIKNSDYVKRLKGHAQIPLYPEVPWGLLEPHEKQAMANHSQTLKGLASRGGLSPQEMIYIIKHKKWKVDEEIMEEGDAILELNKLVEEYLKNEKV